LARIQDQGSILPLSSIQFCEARGWFIGVEAGIETVSSKLGNFFFAAPFPTQNWSEIYF